jgi:GT2 family glycosyltransferase
VTVAAQKKIVLLGMMTRIPVAGVVWQTIHYLVGLRRLGYDAYYVEAHARTPSMLMEREEDDSGAQAAAFIDGVMRRFDFGDRWAFVALHDQSRRCYGLGERELASLYDSAEIMINLHGGTLPRPELVASDRLVYLETDPVQLQVELHQNVQETIEFLEPHCAFFTFAENYGNPDCLLPVQDRFPLKPTRQPVVLDFWQGHDHAGPSDAFTTVGNWRQQWREVTFQGVTYGWSKHREFLKFIDLPARTDQAFELALSSYEEEDRRMLEDKGWRVRHALDFSTETDPYRDYIAGSRGEFTVAKDQNVRLRTGWFSDRSATYLAAGRPVISQDTGFSNVFPTGEGLFGFATLDEAVEAVERVNSDYERSRRAATEVAREYFSYDVVLSQLMADVGVERARRRARTEPRAADGFPPQLSVVPRSRRPVTLEQATVDAVLSRPVPSYSTPAWPGDEPTWSIVVVTHDNLVFTRMCLESVLWGTRRPAYELLVVDNASTDGTTAYLGRLAREHANVRVILNAENAGFAVACNQGLAEARGDLLVLLNNDTLVPPRALSLLAAKLEDADVGLVGPTTNRIGNEAEIETDYQTWEGLLEFAARRADEHEGEAFDIPTLTMFCLAMRRDAHERIGPLDERFTVGLLEDDDYSRRAREAGLRLLCADDAFVHHFGEGSFGKLVASGEYGRILEANRRRFAEKWGDDWQPYARRRSPAYEDLKEEIRRIVAEHVPAGATVLVVSKGDDDLLELSGRIGWHFPAADGGGYAGHHPGSSEEAVAQLEALRARGGQFLLVPGPSLWWLDHYAGLNEHLRRRYRPVVQDASTCALFALNGR